jgi:predicted RNase H-like HicB family nuclease
MAQMSWTAVYMKVPEAYIAFVEELPGANTQGATLEEARANLEESYRLGKPQRAPYLRRAVSSRDQ